MIVILYFKWLLPHTLQILLETTVSNNKLSSFYIYIYIYIYTKKGGSLLICF